MNRIQAGFVDYMRRAGLATEDGGRTPRCSPGQWREMRLAWFFGAWHLYCVIQDGVSPGVGVTREDMDLMGGIHDEMARFMEDVASGRA